MPEASKVITKTAQQQATSIASRTWCTPKTLTLYANETWLNQNISNSEILHSGFTIFRRDRSDRGGGGVLLAIKTDSFKVVKEFNNNNNLNLNRK